VTDDATHDGAASQDAEATPAAEPAPPAERAEFEVVDTEAGDGDGEGTEESVSRPSKLIRIASMVRQMLEEVRQSSLDEQGRQRLRVIYERAMGELRSVLSPDLAAELNEIAIPFGDEIPTESELRISQAQLVGWLEGLFHGIQATIFSQQLTMQKSLEEMRERRSLEEAQGATRTGPYL
jgi:hypothetical protein